MGFALVYNLGCAMWPGGTAQTARHNKRRAGQSRWLRPQAKADIVMKKQYQLAEPTWINNKLYGPRTILVNGEKTGEYRNPKKNEFFVSGAIPGIYRAPSDLSCKYHIIKIKVTQ